MADEGADLSSDVARTGDDADENRRRLLEAAMVAVRSASTAEMEEFAASSNGDRWYLIHEEEGEPFVLHKANAASGGHQTRISLRDFLDRDGSRPEEQALITLLRRDATDLNSR